MLKPGECLALILTFAQIIEPVCFAAQIPPPKHHLDLEIAPEPIRPYSTYSDGNTHKLDLPEMGDPSGTMFTPSQEKALGESFFRSLHSQARINKDPEVSEYIQTIGQKLASNSDNPNQTFHFFVVDSPEINAFAGPGGYIGVNSGLILITEAESELASVLGHEIAHVTQRHLYQALQASGKIQLLSFAAMLAAALVGSRVGGGANYQNQPYCTAKNEGCQPVSNSTQGLVAAALGAGSQAMINFTRDNEAEADNIGMQILSRSEFDPRSMPDFFEKMQQSTRFSGHGTPEFLLTHPVTLSRISDTRNRAEKFTYRQYPDGFTYQLIRAKLRVGAMATPKDAVNWFAPHTRQGTPQQQDVARYGLGLAKMENAQYEEGKQLLRDLVEKYPEQSHFINALAKAEEKTHNDAKAIELYAQAMERFPGNPAIRLNYVQLLLVNHKYDKARKILETMMQGIVEPDIYEMMGKAYSGLGDEAQSHRYLGEAYFADGQIRQAIMHMMLARQLAGDGFYINSIIDERLSKFREEEKEQRKENRDSGR